MNKNKIHFKNFEEVFLNIQDDAVPVIFSAMKIYYLKRKQ